MADLLRDDTDFEMLKYTEANDIAEAGLNPAILKNKKSVFNPETGTNDILLPMPSGGYTKVGEEGVNINRPGAILLDGIEYGPDTPEYQRYYPTPSPLAMTEAPAMGQPAVTEAAPEVSPQTKIEDVQSYAQQLQEQQGAYTLEDLTAAGYSEDAIAAAGLDVAIAPPQTRTEALTPEEVTNILSEGGSLIGGDPTLREEGSTVITNFAFDLMVSGLRADLEEKGTSPRTIEEEIKARTPELTRQAEVYSNILFGTSAKNPLGAGALDFLTGGIMDIQEGYRLFEQSREANKDSLSGRAIGMGMMLAGVAEATGVGYGAGKLIKKGLQKIQPSLVQMGADAEQRIAQEGNMLFSNPVGPIVDRGLAAAGKLAGDAPSATTPNQAGSAIKLYHGTDAPEFKQFDPSQARTAKHIYTSPIRDDAAAYGKNVLEFETNANILDLRADTRGVNETKVLRQAYNDGGLDDYFESFDDFLDAFDNGDMYQRFGSQNAQNAVIDELFAASGADGLRIPDAGFGGSLSESIVFEDPSKLQRVTQEPAKPSAAELRRQANIQRFGYDPNEAPADTSYRMQHQPTGPEGGEGIRLDDLTKNISGEQAGYPEDFYSPKGQRVYAQGPSFKGDEYGLANQESYKVIKSVRGNPDAEVTMYRAVPNEDAITTINPGDFVTLSPTYAKLHAASGYGRSGNEAGKVLEQKVKVRDIYWDGNDVNEFGYFPEEQ